MRLSIVVPALNEAPRIGSLLDMLAPLRAAGVELIVVDGGSADDTRAIAHARADRVVASPRGRARQMNAGAGAASGDVLLFLHADSRPPAGVADLIREALASGAKWGRFDVEIEGRPAMLRVVAWFMNHRSRLTGIATGDQGLFMTRAAYDQAGGFPEQPLMEDIEMCKRLKRVGRPACLPARMITSGRRWEKHGVWPTIILMWRLRLAYFLGANPDRLHRIYYGR
jgi:rSAM/selenodomain-associated transferase 2